MLREQIQWAVGGAPHIGEKPRRFSGWNDGRLEVKRLQRWYGGCLEAMGGCRDMEWRLFRGKGRLHG